jgi:hypothetical protein
MTWRPSTIAIEAFDDRLQAEGSWVFAGARLG